MWSNHGSGDPANVSRSSGILRPLGSLPNPGRFALGRPRAAVHRGRYVPVSLGLGVPAEGDADLPNARRAFT